MVKKLTIIVISILLICAAGMATTVTVDDIIKLHKEGVKPEVIKAFIKSSGQIFHLTADDIIKLKKAGVPDDIIQLMLETATPKKEKAKKTEEKPSGEEIEPKFPYRLRYHSVFSFQVFKKKRFFFSDKILEVGKRDPLKNTAKRGGTLFLTDKEIVMFDMDGDERYRLAYTNITQLRIEIRYTDHEAQQHPLDTYVLWIYFKKNKTQFFIKVYTLPKPEKQVPHYGDVFDIAKAIREIGKAVNPKLKAPVKKQ